MLRRLRSMLTGTGAAPAAGPAGSAPTPAAGGVSAPRPSPALSPQSPAAGAQPPVLQSTRRVLSIVHDPLVAPGSGRTLSQALGWQDPGALEAQYAADVRDASHGLVRYEVVERVRQDGFPAKADGFRYDVATYLRCWRGGGGFHEPDAVDYLALLREFEAVQKVNAGDIDEVWLFGPPYAGYYESIMAGPGAFWCNAPALAVPASAGLPPPRRRFVIMGFNYEREVGCMLEDLGHRAESILARVYEGRTGEANLWERFARYDRVAPGRAAVGNMHFAPNSTHDYDWGNRRPVSSECDGWRDFPHLTGERRMVDCRDWGNGDMRAHHLWWFKRLPHAPGETAGILNNWWTYVADPNTVR